MFKTSSALFNSYEKKKVMSICRIQRGRSTGVYEGKFYVTFTDGGIMHFSTYMGHRSDIAKYSNLTYEKNEASKYFSYTEMNPKLYNKILNFKGSKK